MAQTGRLRVRPFTYVVAYVLIASFVLMAHGPLLWTPFVGDEIGQFVPASLDLFHSGAWIPHSTLPNVHPPGVMAYLALFWQVTGYSIAATRVAMLLLASLGVLFAFLLAIELARGSVGSPALPAAAWLCLCPLVFSQSAMAQLDMPAMCLSALALLLFLQDRIPASAAACVALAMVKETGIVAPALFGIWLLAERRRRDAAWFLLPVVALAGWLIALRQATGHWLGNAQFTEYNLFFPLHPVRFAFSTARRLYYLLVSSGHAIGTAAFLFAYRRTPIFRNRAWRVAAAFAALHTLAVTALGGAVLERYLLPALPVVYAAFAISIGTLARRLRTAAGTALALCLIACNFVDPPYPFPFENNLTWVSFADLELEAAYAVESRPGTIATTFPFSDALRRPEAGFVAKPRRVLELKGFRARDLTQLRADAPETMIFYETAIDRYGILDTKLSKWLMGGYYGYERNLTPEEIAGLLPMRVAQRWRHGGLTITMLVRTSAENRTTARLQLR